MTVSNAPGLKWRWAWVAAGVLAIPGTAVLAQGATHGGPWMDTLGLPEAGTAQRNATHAPAAAEPITPIPQPPAADPVKTRLGERLFNDARLSYDNTRT